MASYGPDPSATGRAAGAISNKVLMVVTRSRRDDSYGAFKTKQVNWLLKRLPREKLEALRMPLLEAVRKKFSKQRYRDPSAPGAYPKMLSQELRNSIGVTPVEYGETKSMGEMTGFAIRTTGKSRDSNKLMWLSDPASPWHVSRQKRIAIPVSMEAKHKAARGIGPRGLGKKLDLFSYRKGGEFKFMLIEYEGHSKVTGRMIMTVHYVLWKGTLELKRRRGLPEAVDGCTSLVKRIIEKPWV